MLHPNMIVFYVTNPSESVNFYQKILGTKPLESSPTFAMFDLNNDVLLGLWGKHTVQPTPTTTPGSNEIAFTLQAKKDVDDLFNTWVKQGLKIVQQPTNMDFGYTFVATDLDGHRLRVFTPVQS
jgi:predicted lactoylglutathione lyase